MRTRKGFILLVLMAALAPLLLGGCNMDMGGSPVTAAERVGTGFYEAVKARNFTVAANLFVNPQGAAVALDQLQRNQEKLGDLQSYELRDTVVNTIFSGRRYTLKYVVKYTNFTATETLIMFEEVSESGIRIEVYNVSSEGLRR